MNLHLTLIKANKSTNRLTIYSKGNIKRSISNIRELELLLQNDKLSFLEPIRALRNKIKDFVLDLPVKQSLTGLEHIKENYIKLEEGYVYLNDSKWNRIFEFLINDTCLYKNPSYTTNKDNYTLFIDKAFNQILASFDIKNKYLTFIKLIYQENGFLPQIISLNLQSYILGLLRKTDLSYEELEIPYTNLSTLFGGVIINNLLKASSLKYITSNVSISIPLEALDNLKTLIISVISRDTKQSLALLKDKFKLLHIYQDLADIILLLVEDFALNMCLSTSVEFFDTNAIINAMYASRETILAKKTEIETKITIFNLKLGSALTEMFVNCGLLTKKTAYIDNLTMLKLTITQLSFSLLETEAGYRPRLNYLNRNTHESYYDKPMFSVYISTIERYIHKNRDFDTLTTKVDTKSFQTALFTIDTDFLIFFLTLLTQFIYKTFNDIEKKMIYLLSLTFLI